MGSLLITWLLSKKLGTNKFYKCLSTVTRLVTLVCQKKTFKVSVWIIILHLAILLNGVTNEFAKLLHCPWLHFIVKLTSHSKFHLITDICFLLTCYFFFRVIWKIRRFDCAKGLRDVLCTDPYRASSSKILKW